MNTAQTTQTIESETAPKATDPSTAVPLEEDNGNPHCDDCDRWSMTTGHRCWTPDGEHMYCEDCAEEHEEEFKEEEMVECPGCLRSKNDEDYTQTDCRNCGTEMCNQCYSVSPVEGDDECYCKRCAQVVLDEYEKEHTCEVCNDTYDDADIVGCCRDGKCETKVENMCRGCGTWDEAKEVWQCPDCIEAV